VTNTGDVGGAEVVQVYVADREASMVRPPKELKGFARVELAPGETKTVEVGLDFRSFAFWHPEHGRWVAEDGDFDLHIGASAADIRFVWTVQLSSSLDLRSLVDDMSTPADWLADPRTCHAMEGLLRELEPFLLQTFAEPRSAAEQPTELDDYVMDMPLRDVLEFASPLGGPDPDATLARLRGGA
jgi:beta-glucosidase